MQFDGFSVDNIGSFRRHFSVKGLLEAIDLQVVFENWMDSILHSGGLDERTVSLIRDVEGHFEFWVKSSDACSTEGMMDLNRYWENNAELCRKFMAWECKVKKGKLSSYHAFCNMFCLLLEIGEYSVMGEEEEIIYNFLLEQEILVKKILRVRVINQNKVSLFCGQQFVADIPSAGTAFYRQKSLVSVAENPDSGYLGITEDGKVFNGSAFELPFIGPKAVKICMNQGAYAILLEDGKIIHNLRYSNLPGAPVRNIELSGEQLVWQLMD